MIYGNKRGPLKAAQSQIHRAVTLFMTGKIASERLKLSLLFITCRFTQYSIQQIIHHYFSDKTYLFFVCNSRKLHKLNLASCTIIPKVVFFASTF